MPRNKRGIFSWLFYINWTIEIETFQPWVLTLLPKKSPTFCK